MDKFKKEFISKLIIKDSIAFGEFYQKTIDIFYRFIKSTYGLSDNDASDVLSDFYSKIWQNITNINLDWNFESYIWTAIRNTTKDFLSSKKLYNFSEFEKDDEEWWVRTIEDDLVWDNWDYLTLLQKDYEFKQIQDSLIKLDSITQQVIFLKYIQWLSFDEISEELWISNDNIRQKLSRGIKKLKQLLE